MAPPPRPAPPLPPPVPLAAGTRIGRYEVRSLLGGGAFGLVYRVHDAEHGTELAVREYLPNTLARREGPTAVVPRSPETAETFALGLRFFVNESELLPRFAHPSLVSVVDAWQDNGTAYRAMELVTGRDLHSTYMASGRPPREPVLRVMMEALLAALEPMHRAKLQHRDLSPQTIVLQPDGRPVLMELGSPRRVTAARGERGATGPRDGYAPIELYGDGGGHPRGPWTDFYALAATMHFLICGRAPPPAATREGDDAIAMKLHRSDLRHSLEFLAVLDWMLAPLPADRPQTVAEVRAALAGQGVPARFQPPAGARLAAALRRHRRWLYAGMAIFVLAAAAIALPRLLGLGTLSTLVSSMLSR